MSKIIKALKQAVRYARGDKSAGRLTVVELPRETALQKAKRGAGRWVRSSDMNQMTNVYGRVVRLKGGALSIYHPDTQNWPIEAWFFPDAD